MSCHYGIYLWLNCINLGGNNKVCSNRLHCQLYRWKDYVFLIIDLCFEIYWMLSMSLFPVWSELTDQLIRVSCFKTDPVRIGSARSFWEDVARTGDDDAPSLCAATDSSRAANWKTNRPHFSRGSAEFTSSRRCPFRLSVSSIGLRAVRQASHVTKLAPSISHYRAADVLDATPADSPLPLRPQCRSG